MIAATLILTLLVKIMIATLILMLVVKITKAIKDQIKLTRNKLGFFEYAYYPEIHIDQQHLYPRIS
ncbi:MAG: hypothetical protein WBQ16_00620 [Nitrososphaeraceae archaeon]